VGGKASGKRAKPLAERIAVGRGATVGRSREVAMRLGNAEYDERHHGGYVVELVRA